jgi:MFS family permease
VAALFLARAIPGASAESLRAELWLTDQALGTLASAFAGAYAAGLPAGAYLARRSLRMRLLAGGLALCGAATAASALAHGFFWLAFGRCAAGFGAGLGAGAAVGVLAGAERRRGEWPGLLPAAGGLALGYLVGGLCGRAPGWRLAFVLAGAALAAAGVVHLRWAEPAGALARPWEELREQGGLRAALRHLSDRPRSLGFAAAVAGAAGLSALGFWLPAFLVRLKTTPSSLAGGQLAAAVAAAAIAGAAVARVGLRVFPSERAPRWLGAACAGAAALALAAALAWSGPVLVLAVVMVGLAAAWAAVACALTPLAARDAPEPAALALAVLAVHALGEVAGPIAVGAFADRASLGRALVFLPAALLASAILWAASAWVRETRTPSAPGPRTTRRDTVETVARVQGGRTRAHGQPGRDVR